MVSLLLAIGSRLFNDAEFILTLQVRSVAEGSMAQAIHSFGTDEIQSLAGALLG